jgi:hypothetical protein
LAPTNKTRGATRLLTPTNCRWQAQRAIKQKIVGLADRIIRGTVTSRAATLTALGPASVLFRHV